MCQRSDCKVFPLIIPKYQEPSSMANFLKAKNAHFVSRAGFPFNCKKAGEGKGFLSCQIRRKTSLGYLGTLSVF